MDCAVQAGINSGVDSNLVKSLETAIKSYDMVVLVVDGEGLTEGLTHRVTEYLDKKNTGKRILLISRHGKDHKCGQAEIRQISEEYEAALLSIYRMYDCSDHFSALVGDVHYGNILNYVENGILTWEEALDAVLSGC